MTPEEEISQNIVEMGYILPTLRAQYPSYYKLTDGTLLKVIVEINQVLPDPRQPEGFNVNTTNLVTSFVPLTKRRREAFVPFGPSELNQGIIDEDVEYEVLRESFSVYDLSNGYILSVKPVIGQVKKTKFYSVQGEPVYITNINPIIKVKRKNL